ncbi:Neurotransmitter-gated ion-channel transmembrane region [Paragonimus heterotremus]|uniref:Neurotransmitter-gated ion-channel transmembrane region n=1 Tax=Paragonimus heterotremus TaxID=100268 RepID=A0A8J4SXQ9_9TREM|nr:Neurotransmitter-gated ion-channel transmembrane region [Paragonimus heterotremus]
MSNYVQNGEWDILKVIVVRQEVVYPCCDEPYPYLRFTIYMRRRNLYYLFNIILPCLWLTVLSLISFWLPPDSGEKITLGITVLLAFSVFMLLIAEKMPATSEFVPLIGIYLTVTMAMTSLSIILTVGVLHIHHRNANHAPVPEWLRIFLFDMIAPLLRMSTIRRYRLNLRSGGDYPHMVDDLDIQPTIEKPDCTDGAQARFVNRYPHLPNQSSKNSDPIVHSKEAVNIDLKECFAKDTLEMENHRISFTMGIPPTEKDSGNTQAANIQQETEGCTELYQIPMEEKPKKLCIGVSSQRNLTEDKCLQPFKQQHRLDIQANQETDPTTNKPSSLDPSLVRSDKMYNSLTMGLATLIQQASVNQARLLACLDHLQQKQTSEQNLFAMINEWQMVAVIVDRLLFWLFLLVATLTSVIILIIMPLFKPEIIP